MRRRNDQKGMTLVEVLIAISIASLIMGVLGSVVFQFTRTTERGKGQFDAAFDVQNAGYWFNLDGKMAETTDLVDGAPPVQTISLMWDDGGANHTTTYFLSGSELKRTYDGNTTTIARNITQIGFSMAQRLITANITSEPSGRLEVDKQAICKVYMRSDE